MKISFFVLLVALLSLFSACKFSNTIAKTTADGASISYKTTAKNKFDFTIIAKQMSMYIAEMDKHPNKKGGTPIFTRNQSNGTYEMTMGRK